MKKALVFVLAMLYVTVSSGVMVNIHYCMGNVASVDYGADKSAACGKCGMQQKKNCCHTEHQLIKADQLQTTAFSHVSVPELLAEPLPEYGVSFRLLDRSTSVPAFYHAPPDPRLNSVYRYNCVFRV